MTKCHWNVPFGPLCVCFPLIFSASATISVQCKPPTIEASVDVSTLRNVDEELSKQPRTKLISPVYPVLKKVTQQSLPFMLGLIQTKTKLKVVLNGTRFDLLYMDGEESILLSHKIEELEETEDSDPAPIEKTPEKMPSSEQPSSQTVSDTLTLNNIKYVTPTKEKAQYFFYSCTGSAVTVISTSNADIELLAQVTMEKPKKEYYEPKIEEICLAEHGDLWCRAALLSKNDNSFQVLFVDYGNIETLNENKFIRIPEELLKIPVLGIKCYFKGVPEGQKIEKRLKELLSDGDLLEAEIDCELTERFQYGIHIPEIIDKLKKENLM